MIGATYHYDKSNRTTPVKNYYNGKEKEEYIGDDKLSEYIYFSEEQRETARNTDLAEFLVAQGESVKKIGSEYEWNDGSQKITIKGNLWYSYYEQKGGDVVDFVCKYYNLDYPDAVNCLLNGSGRITKSSPVVKIKEPFRLPKHNRTMNRMIKYLLQDREIDKDVLYAFIAKGMIYESDYYHNAVFVGYDKDGVPRHAHMRATTTKTSIKLTAESSLPEYSFHWTNPGSDKLYLFEAPIDMLSYISMHSWNWQLDSYAAACSVSDKVLMQCLKDNPKISTVYLCFDNDKAGRKANTRIADKLKEMNINYEILVPQHKDWNEDLLCEEEMGENLCQGLK